MDSIVLSVVIPVYNEEKTIGSVLEEHLRELQMLGESLKDWEIVCVDDGSTDGSHDVMTALARQHPKVRIIRHEQNRGIAASFNHLFHESAGTHVYVTAADDQWPASNLGFLFRRMQETSSDLVIGVRQNRAAIYTPWRRLLSFVFNAIPKYFYKIDTQDANGIKLGRREIFVMPVRSQSFFAEIERIILAKRQGYVITTAPIIFQQRSKGKAKGASWRNIRMTLRDLIKFVGSP